MSASPAGARGSDRLLGYYMRELSFLRQMGVEFAERYPKVAAQLDLEAGASADPHVERLIEAFAFLAARVHLKVDDEFPELTESLLNVLYPGVLAPFPSSAIVQFVQDPQRVNVRSGQLVPKGSALRATGPGGSCCRFRTAYPVELWPVQVTSAWFEPPAYGAAVPEGSVTALRLRLQTLGGVPWRELRLSRGGAEEPLSTLRLHLHGEPRVAHTLYEYLLNELAGIEMRPGGNRELAPLRLAPDVVRPVGFEEDQGLLPHPGRRFLGYRLLTELFAFPDKFLFLDLAGLEAVAREEFEDVLVLLFYFRREFPLESAVQATTFRLNATPVVNLFRQVAEPIRVTHVQPEYPVVPDLRRHDSLEVYSVDAVTGSRAGSDQAVEFQPFYSLRHGASRRRHQRYWYASRRPGGGHRSGASDVFLSIVDLGFDPVDPGVESLTVEATCSDGHRPWQLAHEAEGLEWELDGAAAFTSIACTTRPSRTLRPPARRGLQWRLISHLSLNVLSLVESEGWQACEALKEILTLHDLADTPATRQLIDSISRVQGRRVLRATGPIRDVFVRGMEVSIELDEPHLVGNSLFLFAQVLERFIGLYASVNSFSELVVSTGQRDGILKRWPPRAGEAIVL